MDGQSGRPGVGSSGTQPPGSPTAYSGNYVAGLVFNVTAGGLYFNGYWWWVPTGGDTNTNIGFALWQAYDYPDATVIPASEVLWTGAFTAGAWNFVPCNPIPLTPNVPYVAAIGYSTTIGFPDTKNQFGSGDPYVNGITNGPLMAYPSGSSASTFWPQQPFNTNGADASVHQPDNNDADDLLWLDVQVTDAVPPGTPERAWPTVPTPIQTDTSSGGFTLGMEFSLSQSAQLASIWHYSPSGATVLPTRCAVWDVGSQTVVAGTDNSSPTWVNVDGSAATAGNGWIKCDYRSAAITLAAGDYKVATFNAGGSIWWAYSDNMFNTGQMYGSGFTQDILTIPGYGAASPGQMSYNSNTWAYPDNATLTYALYWIDVEVVPEPAANYRFMDGQDGRPGNGPTTPVSYSGNFISGVGFMTLQGNCWFEGYWHWVCPTGGLTAPQKFALWQINPLNFTDTTLVPGSVVTSGALSTGWNYVALPMPILLSEITRYIAATGINGAFPDSDTSGAGTGAVDSFGAGGHPNGIQNGPILAFADGNSSYGSSQYNGGGNIGQGLFTVGGTDPSATCPLGVSNSANFWIDIQVTTTTPNGYTGSYRAWPNKFYGDQFTTGDSAVDYVVGTEMRLNQSCAVNNIWYYSPSGTAQLATRCDVWDEDTQAIVASNTSPTWSGIAGSGWVSCALTGVTLPAGRYRVSVYNSAAVPDAWSAKQLYYFNIGAAYQFPGSAIQNAGPTFDGIRNGVMHVPGIYAASSTSPYTGSGAPANFDQGGSTQGQAVFAVGPPNAYPDIYVKGLGQTYWVDMEVTPSGAATSTSALLLSQFP